MRVEKVEKDEMLTQVFSFYYKPEIKKVFEKEFGKNFDKHVIESYFFIKKMYSKVGLDKELTAEDMIIMTAEFIKQDKFDKKRIAETNIENKETEKQTGKQQEFTKKLDKFEEKILSEMKSEDQKVDITKQNDFDKAVLNTKTKSRGVSL